MNDDASSHRPWEQQWGYYASCRQPYVAGYLLGSTAVMRVGFKERSFNSKWQATLYRPAARAETAMTGTRVLLYYE
jgi:hypothetical protein